MYAMSVIYRFADIFEFADKYFFFISFFGHKWSKNFSESLRRTNNQATRETKRVKGQKSRQIFHQNILKINVKYHIFIVLNYIYKY
jgi:hypothetical protein